jgi:hypothetical protein
MIFDFSTILSNTILIQYGASRESDQPKDKFLHKNCSWDQEVALFQSDVCLWKNCESSVGALLRSPQISLAAITPFGENPASS